MTKFIFVILIIFLAGCTGVYQRAAGASALDRAALIGIAKDELNRRGLELPRVYEVDVENGEIGNEIGPPRPIYSVSFTFPYRGRATAVYIVFIDKRSGKVDQVSDYRAIVPSRV